MHPLDDEDRRGYLQGPRGIGLCNITKCCTEVCPEHIKITDNAIIPLKERVVDEFYDPIQWAWRKLRGKSSESVAGTPLPMLQGGSASAAGSAGAAAPPSAGGDEPPTKG